jgi:hypothetical protein
MLTAALPTALHLLMALQVEGTTRLAVSTPRNAAADSQRVLRDARSAQTSFERTRRANLPLNTRGTSGRCDVRVGRFCYWWDDGEFTMPPEPAKTKAARTALLRRLDAAATRVSGDRWIAGQRVRYLVEDGRARDAVAAASECRAAASWCAALAGYALHAAADFAAADSAFAVALAEMPDAERCRWTDITLLLEDDARKRYEKLSCEDRSAFETRFWALARPLYLLPANDLRTEHFARLTMAELLRTSRYPHDLSWGDDSKELLVRYGWETGWSRELPSVSSPGNVHVVGHEPTPAFDFVPGPEALASPDAADAADWLLNDRFAQTRYAPRYARSVNNLEHQVAFFRRGDSAIVVAAFDLARDTAFSRDSVAAALSVAPAFAPESASVVTDSLAARRHVLSTASAWAPLLVSVEAHDSSARRVARVRAVVRPPSATSESRVTVSDLLLFDDPALLPASLEEATPRARGSMRVERASPVGVYWEMYGVAPEGESLAYTLTVTRVGRPWLRRAAEKLGVMDRRPPVRMKWDEPSGRQEATRSRALAVDFSTLPEGRYRIELSLEAAGQAAAVASRLVDVRD